MTSTTDGPKSRPAFFALFLLALTACDDGDGALPADGASSVPDASSEPIGMDAASEEDPDGGIPDAGESRPFDGGVRCDPPTENTMVDPRDCRAYRVVTIGEQTWLAENLAFETEGGSACYDDERTHCATYGRLYDWAATMGLASSANHERVRPTGPARGICPPGWHVPSGGEWERLFEAAGGRAMAAPRLRADSDLWQQGSSNDATGFGALPGGYRGHRFSLEGFQAHFQASDETSDDTAAFAFLSGISDRARLDDDSSGSDNDKTRLRSVRCLRD